MKRLALALLLSLAAAAPAAAATVDSGTIVVGKGAAGARLGMTAKQVKAKLGKPVDVSNYGVLSYQGIEADGIFDIYPGGHKRMRMFIISFPDSAKWTVGDIPVFKPHAIPQLAKVYGGRLKKHNDTEDGIKSFEISGHYRRHKVLTEFEVDSFNRAKARVLDVDILYLD